MLCATVRGKELTEEKRVQIRYTGPVPRPLDVEWRLPTSLNPHCKLSVNSILHTEYGVYGTT